MGILNRTHNLSQYKATTNLPNDFINKIADRVRHFSFRDIDLESTEDYSCGWVNYENILDAEFESIEFLKEPYLVISFRVDKRSIPSSTLQRHILQKENEIKEQEEVEFLPKSRIEAIKESEKAKLIIKAEPTTQVHDLIWNTQTGLVLFTNTSPKICDEMQELFYKTFDIRLSLNELSLIGSEILKDNNVDDEIANDFKYADFIGSDFLTWLWNESGGNGMVFNNIDILFDGKVVLINDDLDQKETVTCVGNSRGMKEIETAIENNKKIIQAKLLLVTEAGEFNFTLDAAYFDMKSVKSPKIKMDLKEDPDGYFYEKMYMLGDLVKSLNYIYKEFVLTRI